MFELLFIEKNDEKMRASLLTAVGSIWFEFKPLDVIDDVFGPMGSCHVIEMTCYIAEYSKVLELEAELVKKKDMIEQVVFIKLSKSYSKLEKDYISLKIVMQQSKEWFQNDKPCENQDAPEFHEFFEINELRAQLQAKNTTISNLKNRIQELKGKSMADCTEYVTNSKVIALGMFKLDLEPLSPKLNKYREAHVNYLKTTKDNADILRNIAEQARISNPSNNALEYTLAQNPSPSTPYVPPTKKDWDILFQPMFDEYFQPPSVVSRAPAAATITPIFVDTTGTPSSTLIDQDAPSASTLLTLKDLHEPVLHQDIEGKEPPNA
ncbi:hypothetical protein Tco_0040449 [Tanacetum coccineum]